MGFLEKFAGPYQIRSITNNQGGAPDWKKRHHEGQIYTHAFQVSEYKTQRAKM
jgi:hypothetical protein